MATLGDFQDVSFVDGRTAVVPIAREQGPTGEDVEFGEGVGGVGQGDGVVEDGRDELIEQFELARGGIFLGVKNLLFLLLEGLGHIALAAHRRLSANIIGGDQVQIGFGNLDVVTEIICEPNLEAADAGAFLFTAFEIGKPGFIVRGESAETVEFGVVTGAEVVAISEIVGEFVGERANQELPQSR